MKHRCHNGASQNIIMVVLEVAVVVFIVIAGATNMFSLFHGERLWREIKQEKDCILYTLLLE